MRRASNLARPPLLSGAARPWYFASEIELRPGRSPAQPGLPIYFTSYVTFYLPRYSMSPELALIAAIQMREDRGGPAVLARLPYRTVSGHEKLESAIRAGAPRERATEQQTRYAEPNGTLGNRLSK
jgi:hypothetical protein